VGAVINKNLNYYRINKKFRVATEIWSNFFWFLTSYRETEIVQNDYISSVPIDRRPLFLFEFRDSGRIMAVGYWAKPQNQDSILGFFHHHHEIFDP
jgi:hypothetical protein